MERILNKLFNNIACSYMNKEENYNEEYYIQNHLKHLNSFYGFFTKLYYRYIASYIMAKPAKIHKGSKILDVGCGVGILVEQFNKLGYDAIGIDINHSAIDNSICPKKGFLVENIANLEYSENYFDLVVSREVLEHIPQQEIDKSIQELDRVSKGLMIHIIAVTKRGKSATKDPTHVNVQTENWWVSKFQQYGYKVIKKPKKFFLSPFGSSGYLMAVKG